VVLSACRTSDPQTALESKLRDSSLIMEWALRRQQPRGEVSGSEVGRALPHEAPASARRCSAVSGRRERTDRNVISVQISERELLGLSVRIDVWLLFELSDERACPLKRQVEIIDAEEQQEAVARCPVTGAHQWRMLVGTPLVEAEQDSSI